MDSVWQWGIEIIRTIQTFRSPGFDRFFISISALGRPAAYMLFLSGLYWIFDRRRAGEVIVLFYFSGWANSVMKDMIGHPRPYNLDSTLKVGHSGGPGLPSNHAQQSFVVFTALSLWFRRPLFAAAAAALIVLVGFSRIYLGVHFPTDVIGGWTAGSVILFVFGNFSGRAVKFFSKVNSMLLTALALGLPLAAAWLLPGKFSVMSMASLSGFCTGLITERDSGRKGAPSPDFVNGLLRYLLGIGAAAAVLGAGMLVTKKFFHGSGAGIFATFWAVNFWIASGAPRVFSKLKLQ